MITLQHFQTDALYQYLAQEMMLESDDVDRDVLCVPANMLGRWAPFAIIFEGRLAGFVCFDMEQRYLAMLYVNPAFRGNGIAQFVIRLLQPTWLDVKPNNLLARKLYERLGYVVAPHQPFSQRVRYFHFSHPEIYGKATNPA